MPLYEVLCITAHFREYAHIRDLVHSSASHIMANGGVVRSINGWGTRPLPQRMSRLKQRHDVGDYWTMHYDASPTLMKSLVDRLRQDPRVIRWTTLKLGEKLEDVAKPSWGRTTRNAGYPRVAEQ